MAKKSSKGPKMTQDKVKDWDYRITMDLRTRIQLAKDWEKYQAAVRNTGNGQMNGNLVEDVGTTLNAKLFAEPMDVEVRADDPDFSEQADKTKVIAHAALRNTKILESLQSATMDSLWATTGWVEVGHPLDPWSMDIMRRVGSPNVRTQDQLDESDTADDWVEADPRLLQAEGIDLNSLQQMDPFSPLPTPSEPLKAPKPIFNAQFGYPWAARVDPRLVLIPPEAACLDDIDYYCRFRFITRQEMKYMRGIDFGQASGGNFGEFRSLFTEVTGKDPTLFPDMMMICEVWIVRDRNNPEFNNFYLSYVLGRPDWVIANTLNPYYGMVPLEPVKPEEHKSYYDTSVAKAIYEYAEIFDIGVKGIGRRFMRQLNEKWWETESANLDPVEAKKLNDDRYRGRIKVRDPSSLSRVPEAAIEEAFLYYLEYVKSLARSTSSTNDTDRAQPIQGVSATQSRMMVASAGVNLESFRRPISSSGRNILMKVMHLIGIYNQQTNSRSYQGLGKIVRMEVGMHDFTSSHIYDVKLVGEDSSDAESMMLINQFLRTILSDPMSPLAQEFSVPEIAKIVTRKFGFPSSVLKRFAGNTTDPALMGPGPGQGNPMDPGLSAGGELSARPPEGLGLRDLTEGQHPERMPGSRGANMANALQGAMRTGMGG